MGSDDSHSTDIEAMDVGGTHSCIVSDVDGALGLECWGEGGFGQLGNGEDINKDVPVSVLAPAPLGEVAESLAEAGDEEDQENPAEGGAEEGDANGEPEEDGDVTGEPEEEKADPYFRGVVQVTVGDGFSCARNVEGRVFCWGKADNGRLGNNDDANNQNIPVRVFSENHGESEEASFVLEEALERAIVQGQQQDRQDKQAKAEEDVAPYLANIVQLSAGKDHVCALTSLASGGRVLCWGMGDNGRLGHGAITDSFYPR